MRHEQQVLLIDADDTLWETNLKFERTVASFCELVRPLGYPDDHVRRQVDTAERANIARRGYGARSFLLTLEEVYLSLAGHRAQDAHLEEIRRFARLLVEEPPRLYDGVDETLAHLAPRHRLLYFSKGDAAEQAFGEDHLLVRFVVEDDGARFVLRDLEELRTLAEGDEA